MHSKNQLILDHIATQTPPFPPDLINTRIVAQTRAEKSLSALREIDQYVADGTSKKKMKKIQARLDSKIVKEIGFGSLRDLVEQAETELQRLGGN